jgi:hypothetical protein
MGGGAPLKKRNHPHEAAVRVSEGSSLDGNVKMTKERCKAPAVRGWTVCRVHGARGGAPKGKANGSYRHGHHIQEARAERRAVSDLLRRTRKVIAAL